MLIFNNNRYEHYRKFKKLSLIYENTLKNNKKSREHIYFILKNKKVNIFEKYIYCINKLNQFIIKSYKLKLKLKKGINILPVHILNKVHHGKTHLNLLIIDTKTKKVTRLDPTPQKISEIKTKLVHASFKKFFKKIGYKFTGFSKKNKFIKHGGLCRFATPALYIYGKKLKNKLN